LEEGGAVEEGEKGGYGVEEEDVGVMSWWAGWRRKPCLRDGDLVDMRFST
jgi:hypothetical protein